MGKNSFFKKRGKLSRRNKTLAKSVDNEEVAKAPHSFVIHRGSVGKTIKQLQQDFRRVMEPYTASKLMERRKNSIKDFVSIAGPLNVSHLVIFTRTQVGIYMKLMRLPRGPTLTFKIQSYCLSKDVISSVKKQMTYGKQFQVAPCLMTNLQPREGEMKLQLSARMFLDMFPTITPNKAAIDSIRRSCLINYDPETELYDFRHYSIRVVPVGITKAVKKFMGNKIPDLSRFNDVSDFMTKAGIMSESEGEDDPSAQVTVGSRKVVSGKGAGPQKSSVRLSELGPRLTLQLIKVQEGLQEGTVLYHRHVTKTEQERKAIEKKREKKKFLKSKRKKEQKENIENKSKKKEQHKQKCLAGMNIPEKTKEKSDNDAKENEDDWEDVGDEDDAEYYQQEVGEAPDKDLFSKSTKGKKRKAEDTDEINQKLFKKQMDKKKEKEEEKEKKKNKGKWWERGDSDEDKKEKTKKPKYKPQNEMERYTMNKKKRDKVKAKKRLKTKKTSGKKGRK